ncbi:protein WUSCHEL-like [Rosa chinensis]|uniref:protein WUSCHEL-like n=1 Tax=Rosa chinensis TaxID=74649 RepID=UPI000D09500C|nr:protein WUSCHEL-like [Rosa chinensis]
MEPQNRHPTEDEGSNKAAESSPNMHCKQSNTRWLPTTDQIRILKELYDDKGVKSPTVEQVQRITLQLKWYGQIENKNVFYWFQNQRAREKLKKKNLTSDVQVPKQRSGLVGGSINLNFGSTSSADTISDGGGGHGGGSYISLELSLSYEGKAGKSFLSR